MMGQGEVNMTNKMILGLMVFLIGSHSTSASSNDTHSTLDHANMDLPNCQTLDAGKLQVKYAVDMGADVAIIEIKSVIENFDEYVAFGLSGSETATKMIGGDVDVMSMDNNGNFTLVDYSLRSQAKCNQENRMGACPDTKVSDMAHDDVTLLHASIESGTKIFRYQRPLTAQDPDYDLAIPTNRSVNVVWARGQRTDDGLISKHTARIPADKNIRINFAQDGTSNCEVPLTPNPFPEVTPGDGDVQDDDNATPSTSPRAGDGNHGTTISISAMLMGFALVLQGIMF